MKISGSNSYFPNTTINNLRCILLISSLVPVALLQVSCSPLPPPRNPQHQFERTFTEAASGAGTGAMIGAQTTAGAGPGVAVGAGLGAVAGLIKGVSEDIAAEERKQLRSDLLKQEELARVHSILAEHYDKRLRLHPSRDIYPADIFFFGDEVKIKKSAISVISEIARLNKERFPWSRLGVIAYSKSKAEESDYAKHITEQRAKEFSDYLIRFGIEGRRIESKAVLLDAPLVIDPQDRAERYSQAIEITPLDH